MKPLYRYVGVPGDFGIGENLNFRRSTLLEQEDEQSRSASLRQDNAACITGREDVRGNIDEKEVDSPVEKLGGVTKTTDAKLSSIMDSNEDRSENPGKNDMDALELDDIRIEDHVLNTNKHKFDPFEGIFFREKDSLVDYVSQFHQRKGKFGLPGAPGGIGILLDGPSGCGKTSVINGLAGITGRHIVEFDLSRSFFTQQQLEKALLDLSIAVSQDSTVQKQQTKDGSSTIATNSEVIFVFKFTCSGPGGNRFEKAGGAGGSAEHSAFHNILAENSRKQWIADKLESRLLVEERRRLGLPSNSLQSDLGKFPSYDPSTTPPQTLEATTTLVTENPDTMNMLMGKLEGTLIGGKMTDGNMNTQLQQMQRMSDTNNEAINALNGHYGANFDDKQGVGGLSTSGIDGSGGLKSKTQMGASSNSIVQMTRANSVSTEDITRVGSQPRVEERVEEISTDAFSNTECRETTNNTQREKPGLPEDNRYISACAPTAPSPTAGSSFSVIPSATTGGLSATGQIGSAVHIVNASVADKTGFIGGESKMHQRSEHLKAGSEIIKATRNGSIAARSSAAANDPGRSSLDITRNAGVVDSNRNSMIESRPSGIESRNSGIESKTGGIESRTSGIESRNSGIEAKNSGTLGVEAKNSGIIGEKKPANSAANGNDKLSSRVSHGNNATNTTNANIVNHTSSFSTVSASYIDNDPSSATFGMMITPIVTPIHPFAMPMLQANPTALPTPSVYGSSTNAYGGSNNTWNPGKGYDSGDACSVNYNGGTAYNPRGYHSAPSGYAAYNRNSGNAYDSVNHYDRNVYDTHDEKYEKKYQDDRHHDGKHSPYDDRERDKHDDDNEQEKTNDHLFPLFDPLGIFNGKDKHGKTKPPGGALSSRTHSASSPSNSPALSRKKEPNHQAKGTRSSRKSASRRRKNGLIEEKAGHDREIQAKKYEKTSMPPPLFASLYSNPKAIDQKPAPLFGSIYGSPKAVDRSVDRKPSSENKPAPLFGPLSDIEVNERNFQQQKRIRISKSFPDLAAFAQVQQKTNSKQSAQSATDGSYAEDDPFESPFVTGSFGYSSGMGGAYGTGMGGSAYGPGIGGIDRASNFGTGMGGNTSKEQIAREKQDAMRDLFGIPAGIGGGINNNDHDTLFQKDSFRDRGKQEMNRLFGIKASSTYNTPSMLPNESPNPSPYSSASLKRRLSAGQAVPDSADSDEERAIQSIISRHIQSSSADSYPCTGNSHRSNIESSAQTIVGGFGGGTPAGGFGHAIKDGFAGIGHTTSSVSNISNIAPTSTVGSTSNLSTSLTGTLTAQLTGTHVDRTLTGFSAQGLLSTAGLNSEGSGLSETRTGDQTGLAERAGNEEAQQASIEQASVKPGLKPMMEIKTTFTKSFNPLYDIPEEVLYDNIGDSNSGDGLEPSNSKPTANNSRDNDNAGTNDNSPGISLLKTSGSLNSCTDSSKSNGNNSSRPGSGKKGSFVYTDGSSLVKPNNSVDADTTTSNANLVENGLVKRKSNGVNQNNETVNQNAKSSVNQIAKSSVNQNDQLRTSNRDDETGESKNPMVSCAGPSGSNLETGGTTGGGARRLSTLLGGPLLGTPHPISPGQNPVAHMLQDLSNDTMGDVRGYAAILGSEEYERNMFDYMEAAYMYDDSDISSKTKSKTYDDDYDCPQCERIRANCMECGQYGDWCPLHDKCTHSRADSRNDYRNSNDYFGKGNRNESSGLSGRGGDCRETGEWRAQQMSVTGSSAYSANSGDSDRHLATRGESKGSSNNGRRGKKQPTMKEIPSTLRMFDMSALFPTESEKAILANESAFERDLDEKNSKNREDSNSSNSRTNKYDGRKSKNNDRRDRDDCTDRDKYFGKTESYTGSSKGKGDKSKAGNKGCYSGYDNDKGYYNHPEKGYYNSGMNPEPFTKSNSKHSNTVSNVNPNNSYGFHDGNTMMGSGYAGYAYPNVVSPIIVPLHIAHPDFPVPIPGNVANMHLFLQLLSHSSRREWRTENRRRLLEIKNLLKPAEAIRHLSMATMLLSTYDAHEVLVNEKFIPAIAAVGIMDDPVVQTSKGNQNVASQGNSNFSTATGNNFHSTTGGQLYPTSEPMSSPNDHGIARSSENPLGSVDLAAILEQLFKPKLRNRPSSRKRPGAIVIFAMEGQAEHFDEKVLSNLGSVITGETNPCATTNASSSGARGTTTLNGTNGRSSGSATGTSLIGRSGGSFLSATIGYGGNAVIKKRVHMGYVDGIMAYDMISYYLGLVEEDWKTENVKGETHLSLLFDIFHHIKITGTTLQQACLEAQNLPELLEMLRDIVDVQTRGFG